MKRTPDPVVALLTAGGKKVFIPACLLGLMEEMAAHPRRLYGHNRAEIFRGALLTLQTCVQRTEREEHDESMRAASRKEAA